MKGIQLNHADIISAIELGCIILCSYFAFTKIINKKELKLWRVIVYGLSSFIIALINMEMKHYINHYYSSLLLLLMISIINILSFKYDISYSIVLTIIAYVISYSIYFLAAVIAFFIAVTLKVKNDYIGVSLIIIINILLITRLFRIKKLKYGIVFLHKRLQNSYYNIIIINVGINILLLKEIFHNANIIQSQDAGIILLIYSISIIVMIKQSLDIYYKQKLLTKDLEQTKSELEDKNKEIAKLEKENLEFSKTSHSLAHKQRALEYKINRLMNSNETINEDKMSIKQELDDIAKEMYREPEVELPKTDIPSIDNMLEYMKSECAENNIKFELQVTGNVHYMVNNLIPENDLEILLADHIKDAIIAINHCDNTNKSIFVRIGKIDNIYSLYIYDTGVEFTKEVLEKLGKEPITTHADEGGTGMGYMNTFDTLNKTNGSLIIREIGEPSVDNYTKVIIIKFDEKKEFKVDTYK